MAIPDPPTPARPQVEAVRRRLAMWTDPAPGTMAVFTLTDVAAVVAAYDQALAGRETWRAKAMEMEAERDRLAGQVHRAETLAITWRARADRRNPLDAGPLRACADELDACLTAALVEQDTTEAQS